MFQSAASLLSPHEAVKNCLSSQQPCGSWDINPISFQSWMFWKTMSQVKVLKVGASDMGSKTLHFSERTESVSSLPVVCCHSGDGFLVTLCPSLSYHFKVGFFSFSCCVEVTQLVSLGGNYPICCCRFSVSLGRLSSGASCVTFLN